MCWVCMCLDGVWVHLVSIPILQTPDRNAHPAITQKILETKRFTQEFSLTALWVRRAEGFTAFLAVVFSLPFCLSSYPECLRFSSILCTIEILF